MLTNELSAQRKICFYVGQTLFFQKKGFSSRFSASMLLPSTVDLLLLREFNFFKIEGGKTVAR